MVEQSKIITQQTKTLKNLKTVDIKSVNVELPANFS